MQKGKKRRTPQQERSRNKIEKILTASMDLLSNEGPMHFTTRRIAARAGVGIGTLYAYYPDKQSIALALIEQLANQEAREVQTHFQPNTEQSLSQKLTHLVRTVVRLYQQHCTLYKTLWFLAESQRQVMYRPGEIAVMENIQHMLEKHRLEHKIAPENDEKTSTTLFHLVQSLALRFAEINRGEAEGTEEINRLAHLYLNLTPPNAS